MNKTSIQFCLITAALFPPSLVSAAMSFTATNVRAGDTSGSISFDLSSCNNCMMAGNSYDMTFNHTPITGGNPGAATLSVTTDAPSCLIISTKTAVDNTNLKPSMSSAFNRCSTDSLTTYISVKNLNMASGTWGGGNLTCNYDISQSGKRSCGNVYIPPLTIIPPPEPDIAEVLTAQYNDMRKDCGNSSQPAFMCSGVMLRVTSADVDKPWIPSSASVTSGGVSFSYLRDDAKFSRLAYGRKNGLIFYPTANRPGGKLDVPVLCAFPIDAATNNRADKGCGVSSNQTINSDLCRTQGIFTAEQWKTHYQQGNNSHSNQCGFDERNYSGYNVADAFYQNIRAMSLISAESINEQNELRLATWSSSTSIASQLPLQAFFYISDGLAVAQKDQQNFYNDTKIIVPIVKVTLPANTSQHATFSFNAADQKVK